MPSMRVMALFPSSSKMCTELVLRLPVRPEILPLSTDLIVGPRHRANPSKVGNQVSESCFIM